MSVSVQADDVPGPGADQDLGGVVYAMTNDVEGNEILAFVRNNRGELSPVPGATVATGGAGASTNAPIDPLGSQNALVYDPDHNLLFAVNAGDNTVAAIE
ncbi:MAG: lactonase family protein, partial [Gammaproteobacteria bacterium]